MNWMHDLDRVAEGYWISPTPKKDCRLEIGSRVHTIPEFMALARCHIRTSHWGWGNALDLKMTWEYISIRTKEKRISQTSKWRCCWWRSTSWFWFYFIPQMATKPATSPHSSTSSLRTHLSTSIKCVFVWVINLQWPTDCLALRCCVDGIDIVSFVPTNIPRKRRLQLLAVALWSCMIILMSCLFFYLWYVSI